MSVEVRIRPHGPFVVTGPITLVDTEGQSYDLTGKESVALCRCGASANRPFCDGSHKGCGFESEDRVPTAD